MDKNTLLLIVLEVNPNVSVWGPLINQQLNSYNVACYVR